MVYSYGNIVTGYGAQLIRNIKLTSDSFEGMPKNLPDSIKISCQIVHICSGCVPLRYNKDKRKNPVFSRVSAFVVAYSIPFPTLIANEKSVE